MEFWSNLEDKEFPNVQSLKNQLTHDYRDLARTCPACILGRQLPENLLFGQENLFINLFSIFEGDNQILF